VSHPRKSLKYRALLATPGRICLTVAGDRVIHVVSQEALVGLCTAQKGRSLMMHECSVPFRFALLWLGPEPEQKPKPQPVSRPAPPCQPKKPADEVRNPQEAR
jgi:hypothetical protein